MDIPSDLLRYWLRKGQKPFSEADFEFLMLNFGFPIPIEVKTFLRTHGAVTFSSVDSRCIFDVFGETGSISHIRTADQMIQRYQGLTQVDDGEEFPKIPDAYLPIGGSFGQDEVLIDCVTVPGRVCYWEYKYEKWGQGENTEIGIISLSLAEFFEKLRFVED